MMGMSYATVPLHRRFCQATGYGGRFNAMSVEEQIARHAKDGTVISRNSCPHLNELLNYANRDIIVQFSADVANGMPRKFVPTQREVRVKPGESAHAFYTAENRSSTPITGVSTCIVSPMKMKF
ncbi:hypothetical protein ACH5RR_013425 [Cinchona calisaya]|uniref:Uncharacterized protein n=1 Tax=Cinchona calisaya TaxID=153742 RepID=A0ABD3A1D1_9GENT